MSLHFTINYYYYEISKMLSASVWRLHDMLFAVENDDEQVKYNVIVS